MAVACLLILSVLDAKTARAASDIKVAATIAPVHSLVAMVTDDLIEPALIVRPGASPHSYALKPSEARALDEADVVFWVGEALEPWMAKAVTTLAADAAVIELGAADGLLRLPLRTGGVWGGHDHDAHNDHDHQAGIDPHLWLDPDNAVIWLEVIAESLAAADPAHADAYLANAKKAADRLRTMSAEIDQRLRPVTKKPYVVFHDAYQYFERRFGLHPLGAVSLGDADRPGPARIVDIRQAIAESQAVCIFAEPQFEPKLIATVIEGSDVKSAVLDPIGAGLRPGAGLYPVLMRGLAASLANCLG
ncbi:MAG: zinc ABC transporter substrate-binding protein [Alphaproteobacteria bacterium]|nr:zinc ABC transporter substrate-binding protein [Alphaproteobacteria bacterium]